MKKIMKRNSMQFEIHIRQEIAKQSLIQSSAYQGHLHVLSAPIQEKQEKIFEEFKVKRESNLKSIWERWRETYLKWISLKLIEPCLIRWEAPDRFLERHEFENLEYRSLRGPARFF